MEPPLSEESEEEEKRRLEAKSREHKTIHSDFFMAITSHLEFLSVAKILASFMVKKKNGRSSGFLPGVKVLLLVETVFQRSR